MLLALLAIAMIAGTAKAGMQLEAFEDFLADRTLVNFEVLVFYQLWAFWSPFAKGALDVVLKYIWENGKLEIEYESNNKISLDYADAFGFIGVGNLNQFNSLIFETVPLIMVNFILPKDKKKSYGTVVDDLLKRLGIDL